MGLPGSGKTTLAKVLAKRIGAVHFNADGIRQNINKDLGFSMEDRIEQARRMGYLCDQVVAAGINAIADFVCPTAETSYAFGEDYFTIWCDRIAASRFPDTNKIFQTPVDCDYHVHPEGTPEFHSEQIARMLTPVFDMQRATALFVGRYQPFHDGHRALIEEGLRRVGQVCIAVRSTYGLGGGTNPYSYEEVSSMIDTTMRHHGHAGRFVVVPLPNITNIFYGRDVGYEIVKLELDEKLRSISATKVRKARGLYTFEDNIDRLMQKEK